MSKTITRLHVRAISARSSAGLLNAGGLTFNCSLGRTGARVLKREGDGASPIGEWRMLRLFYRADRMCPPRTRLPAKPLRSSDGWCETVGDRNYNRLVHMPYAASYDTMTRSDHLYDLVVELSHNARPRVQGFGSAVFFHLRRPDGGPTAGCIAVSLHDMKIILAHCGPRTTIVIHV